jgi:hypothetical protein
VGALCCNLRPAQLLDYTDVDKCYTGAAAMSAEDVDTLYQLSMGLDTDKQLNIYLDCEFFTGRTKIRHASRSGGNNYRL